MDEFDPAYIRLTPLRYPAHTKNHLLPYMQELLGTDLKSRIRRAYRRYQCKKNGHTLLHPDDLVMWKTYQEDWCRPRCWHCMDRLERP